MSLRAIFLPLFFLSLSQPILAQSGFYATGGPMVAYNDGTLQVNEQNVRTSAFGFMAAIDYRIQPKDWHLVPSIGLGFKALSSQGEIGSNSFEGETTKVIIQTTLDYFVTDRWSVGVLYTMENNKNLKSFRMQGTDQERHNLGGSIGYKLNDKIGFTIRYTRVIVPNFTNYLLTNPSSQFGFLINYRLKKID